MNYNYSRYRNYNLQNVPTDYFQKVNEKICEILTTKTEPKSKTNIQQIRRTVATLANQINKKLKNLSKAFLKAWAVVKGKTILTKVSGVSFNNTQKALHDIVNNGGHKKSDQFANI